ncbi:hypothetical protein B0H14DRAFT_2581706 [Mycena olivaceomarginata]|nr:hypothetical protein B0H14DRAFT_2581706 [Mycena olivaceomarginata]
MYPCLCGTQFELWIIGLSAILPIASNSCIWVWIHQLYIYKHLGSGGLLDWCSESVWPSGEQSQPQPQGGKTTRRQPFVPYSRCDRLKEAEAHMASFGPPKKGASKTLSSIRSIWASTEQYLIRSSQASRVCDYEGGGTQEYQAHDAISFFDKDRIHVVAQTWVETYYRRTIGTIVALLQVAASLSRLSEVGVFGRQLRLRFNLTSAEVQREVGSKSKGSTVATIETCLTNIAVIKHCGNSQEDGLLMWLRLRHGTDGKPQSEVLHTCKSRGFPARLWLEGVTGRAKSRLRPKFWLDFGPVPKPKSRGFAA